MEALDIKKLVNLLLEASDNVLDDRMKVRMREWSDPPKAVEVLEVLDNCINGSLATGVAVAALQALYDQQCLFEGTTHDAVVKLATWRKP